jgi:hypothetical protein
MASRTFGTSGSFGIFLTCGVSGRCWNNSYSGPMTGYQRLQLITVILMESLQYSGDCMRSIVMKLIAIKIAIKHDGT